MCHSVLHQAPSTWHEHEVPADQLCLLCSRVFDRWGGSFRARGGSLADGEAVLGYHRGGSLADREAVLGLGEAVWPMGRQF